MVSAVGCVKMTQKAAGAAGCCEFGGEQPLVPGDAWRDCKSEREGGRVEGWRSTKKGSRRFPYSLYHDGEEVQKIAQRSTSPWIHTGWDFLCFQGDRTLSHLARFTQLRFGQRADLGRRLNFAAFPKFRRPHRDDFGTAGRQPRTNIYIFFFAGVAARCERRSDVCRFLCSSRIKFLSGGCHSLPSLTGPRISLCERLLAWLAPSRLAVRKRQRQRDNATRCVDIIKMPAIPGNLSDGVLVRNHNQPVCWLLLAHINPRYIRIKHRAKGWRWWNLYSLYYL